MEFFNEIDDIFRMHESGLWSRTETARGTRYVPAPALGRGCIEYMGELDSYVWTLADYEFYKGYVCRQNIGERYIEIGENNHKIDNTIVYYQTRSTLYPVEKGLNCFVNISRFNMFSRLPAAVPVTFTSLLIRESFFSRHGITLPEGFWQAAAQVLNPDVLYIPEVSSVLRQAEAGMGMPPAALAPYLKAKVIEVIALLIEYVETRKHKAAAPLDESVNKKIALAKEILAGNLNKPPLVEELCAMVGLNKNLLQKGFRQNTGHSAAGYLRACRMEKALGLLQQEQAASIKEIALQVGYHSAANFYKAFEKTFSVSPGEMRKQLLTE